MLIAAAVSSASSSASKTVTASAARCRLFMLMIVSKMARVIPAARSAANDDPYSTTRCSSRWYQTRWGMWCTSGCPPVASDERHTGVSDGNVETARSYRPCSARNVSAGVRLSPTADSNTEGVRPSMTIRMTFLVSGKGAQSRIALGHAAAQARGERGDDGGLDVTDAGDPRQRGEQHGGSADEQRRPQARASAPQCPGDELRRAERAERAACAAADRLVPLPEREPDDDAGAGREHERRREQRTRGAEERREQHADPDPEPRADADPVPATHAWSVRRASRPESSFGTAASG